ncbi:bifunctional hydroxymethylpyrimidine kinase/phosphomethylpyrimidine kinase [Maricaulaceae bacterium EIL42A08]|nr:bifunctional hydroxymethylpyrimidine kinase/phosphomethylpyrimidine kinase [Maricaulaceae bacterium EIL42A08]
MTETTDDLQPQGRVLSIAGSDSSGGAGIQADIKAVTALGGYAATAITAITVQNTKGVSAVHPVPTDIIAGQIEAVLTDVGADAIKTGMLATADVIETVIKALDEHGDPIIPLVVDPVMVATSGDRLIDEAAVEAVRDRLLPRATLITPNVPEAEALTGGTIEDMESQQAAAEMLLEMGARAALVKGGHMDGDIIIDVLATRNGVRLFTRPRIRTRQTHGTGCTLASAIAALLAQGLPMDRAAEEAGDYLHEAIQRAPGFGDGHGPVNHGWPLAGKL